MHLRSCIRLYKATLLALAMSTHSHLNKHSASHTLPWPARQADLAAYYKLNPLAQVFTESEAEEDYEDAASRSEEERQLHVRETEAEEKKEPAGRQQRRRGAVRGPFDSGLVDLDKHTIVDLP